MELRFPLILDGATGTELQKRGYTGDVCAEQWTLDHPEAIIDIQRGYVAAGSQVVYTPTFGANRRKLEESGLFNCTADYNRRLAELSAQAVQGKALRAGDMSPTGAFLAPLGDVSFEELVDIYTEQAAGLERAGVDLFVIETMMTLSDARAAVLAVRSVSDKPIFVTFTCDENGRSVSGTDITAALVVLQGMGIDAFGLNCSTGPDKMLVQLRRRCGLQAAVWFAVSQLLVTAFWAPHQVQFFTCFAVAYAGCVWVLAKPRRSDDVCLALLVLGVVTSFCDLLVTPVLTLGLPLVCWLLEPQQRLRAGTRQCGIVVGGSLTWGVGYLLCWASKWVLAGLVTGQNVIADALHQVGVRTAADSWHGMELTWRNILHFVYTTLAGKHLFWPLVLAVVLLLALFAASIRDRQQLARALPLGLCALMTPAWFIVLRTHSIQHGWFTWRALGLTVFAGLAFLYYACDLRAARRRLQKGSI